MNKQGLNLDFHESRIPVEDYRYGRNIVLSNRIGAIENEKGNKLIEDILGVTTLGFTILTDLVEDTVYYQMLAGVEYTISFVKTIQRDVGFFFEAGLIHTSPFSEVTGSFTYTPVTDGEFSVLSEMVVSISYADTARCIIGHIPLDEQREVLFISATGYSEIGVMDFNTCVYTKLSNLDDLGFGLLFGFDRNYPITGVHFFKANSECVVAFTDNNSFPRLITLSTDLTTILDATDINDTLLTPNKDLASISVTVLENQGNLESGSYVIGYRYISQDGTPTAFLNTSEVSYLIEDTPIWARQSDGLDGGLGTSNAIQVDLTSVDTRYSKVEFIAIRTFNGIVDVQLINEATITSDTLTYLYTGAEISSEISLEEALIGFASFDRIKSLSSLRNKLYASNVSELTDDSATLQGLANNITMNYLTVFREVMNDSDPALNDQGYFLTFQHGEVYAFYARWIRDDGSYTQAYHIAGRVEEVGDKTIINNWGGETGRDEETYLVDDTCDAVDKLGYWENINEVYPTDPEGNFPTGNVRHHKFPSIAYTKANIHTGVDYGKTSLNSYRVQASNVVIPAGYQGYEILYAKRSFSNSSVVGTDLLFHMGIPNDPAGTLPKDWYQFTGGNYDLKLYINTGVLVLVHYTDMDGKYVCFHNQELIRQTPNLNNLYYETSVRLDMTRDTVNADDHYKFVENKTQQLIDYATPWTIPDGVYDKNVGAMTNQSYIQANVEATVGVDTIKNYASNTRVIGEHYLGNFIPNYKTGAEANYQDVDGADFTNQVSSFHQISENFYTWITTLKFYKTNCYLQFTNQTLVSTGKVNRASTSEVLDGDTYLSRGSFNALGAVNPDDGTDLRATRNAYSYIHMGRFNLKLRHENTTPNGRYYPKTDTIFNGGVVDRPVFDSMLELIETSLDTNDWLYNIDYSVLNDYYQSLVWDGEDTFESEHPYTIYASETLVDNSVNWRLFLPNNAYDMPYDKGVIVNTQTYGEKLIIHQEESLHITRSNTKLETSIGDVTLGSGNLFDVEPQEIIPENENAGTRSKHACTMTKIGYVFVNDTVGKVFVLNDKLNEISNANVRRFFYENLPFYNQTVTQDILNVPIRMIDDCDRTKIAVPFSYCGCDVFLDWNTYEVSTGQMVVIESYLQRGGEYLIELDIPINELLVSDPPLTMVMTCYERKDSIIYPDNPYIGKGYTIGYDEKLNRLLLTKNNEGGVSIVRGQHKGSYAMDCNDFMCFDANDLVLTNNGYGRVNKEGIMDDNNPVVIDCATNSILLPLIDCVRLLENGFYRLTEQGYYRLLEQCN